MSEFWMIVLVSAGTGIAVPLLMFWLLTLLSGPNIRVVPKDRGEG